MNETALAGRLSDGFIVEKARPLMLMQDTPFTLGELKVLDTYLSRINARNPDQMTVRFSKEEYENLMGIDRMRTDRIDGYVSNMMRKIVTIQDAASPGGWTKFVLFEKSNCYKDENEQWWIDMKCSASAKDLFFALESVGYFRYYLSNIIHLTSMYSYQLYLYLLLNRYKNSWSVDIEELKTVLGCKAERYKQFKFFNSEVLKKACAEVNEKTDISFEFSVVKVGRTASKIKFEVLESVDVELEETEQEFESIPDPDDPLALTMEALPKDFTREQVEMIRNLALSHIPFEVRTIEEKELWLYDYISSKTMLMRAAGNVKAPFAWIRQAVSEDWK